MMISRISRYICVLLLLYGISGNGVTWAQSVTPDSVSGNTPVKGIQYSEEEKSVDPQDIPLFSGVSVSGDLVGLAMVALSPYGQLEAACRINLKETYFPIFEMGWGISDHTNETTNLHYKTNAPYFRIGCDYNFAKDRLSGNRILGGVRYAFTSFQYDVDGPDIIDQNWGTSTPFSFHGVNGKVHWFELVFGLEAKIWSFFHLGWTFRYRFRLSNKTSPLGDPWYVPGFGKNDSHALGGTFNIIFDI